MSRRKTPLLAYSEYDSPDRGQSTQAWQARLELIETSKRACPRFVKTLLSTALPLYRDLANTGYDIEQRILWGHPQASAFQLLPEDSGLKSALRNWAAEFNVSWQNASLESAETWLMDEALYTLRDWFTFPDMRDALRWHNMHFSNTVASGEPFEFHFMGWEMQQVTWARYSEMARKSFEEELANYQKKARDLAKSYGLILAQKKYSPDNLEWFVLYQLEGLSSIHIVRRSENVNSLNESTVLKGIKAAARLAGWERLRTTPLTRQIAKSRKIR